MLVFFQSPSADQLAAFLDQQREFPCSYPEVGASRHSFPAGYDHDRSRVLLGEGEAVYGAARKAIDQWQMFKTGWVKVFPKPAPIESGTVVAVVFRLIDHTGKYNWLGWGVILGMLLVAMGITGTHFGSPGILESMAAVWMALFGLGVGVMHIRYALAGERLTLFRGCWLLGGILLSGGMVLAMSYGLRFFFPEGALSIPAMYAWHGTLNAGALALLLLGWLQQGGRKLSKVAEFRHGFQTERPDRRAWPDQGNILRGK